MSTASEKRLKVRCIDKNTGGYSSLLMKLFKDENRQRRFMIVFFV